MAEAAYFKIDLKDFGLKKDASWFVEPLSDIHFGHNNCDKEAYLQAVLRIAQQPNRSTWFNGDMIDNIPPGDFRYGHAESVDPEMPEDVDQEDAFATFSKPIFDKHAKTGVKCFGALLGTHEFARGYYSDKKFKKQFCQPYGIRMLGHLAWIWLDFYHNKKFLNTLKIWTTHGSYGGFQTGGEVNALQRLPAKYDADIFCVGHSHNKNITISAIQYIEREKAKFKLMERTQVQANLGTFLKTSILGHSNYPEKKGMYSRVSKIGTVTFEFNPYLNKLTGHE